jgi:hypothetical protein
MPQPRESSLRQIVPEIPEWRREMPYPKHADPLTDRPREPDELRRLNLELDSRGGTMWPWIAGIIAVIVVVTLLYGYTRKISTTASTPLSSSSSTTTGVAR